MRTLQRTPVQTRMDATLTGKPESGTAIKTIYNGGL